MGPTLSELSWAGLACAALGAGSSEGLEETTDLGSERGAQGELAGSVRAGAPDPVLVRHWQKLPERAPAGGGRQPIPPAPAPQRPSLPAWPLHCGARPPTP